MYTFNVCILHIKLKISLENELNKKIYKLKKKPKLYVYLHQKNFEFVEYCYLQPYTQHLSMFNMDTLENRHIQFTFLNFLERNMVLLNTHSIYTYTKAKCLSIGVQVEQNKFSTPFVSINEQNRFTCILYILDEVSTCCRFF